MRDHRDDTATLLEFDDPHLDLLEWFAEWTPEVHRADWDHRRAWPPGFREISELSTATWKGHEKWQRAEQVMAVPPDPGKDWGRSRTTLLEYRMLEGIGGCLRLTPRGRSALRLAGREAPERFVSHCVEIFDDVLLTPVVLRNGWDTRGKGGGSPGDPLPDETASWERMLVEYHEADYHGRHTITRAQACMSRFSSTGTWLNGSVREHHSGLHLEVHSETRQLVMRATLSLEGLTDLLTAGGHVPITVDYYVAHDGMGRSEPAPPPVSPARRMRERLLASELRQDELIAGLEEKVRGLRGSKRLSQKAADDLLHDLRVARDNGDANRAFVVQQAVDEISVAAESLITIAAERVQVAGGELDGNRLMTGVAALLAPGDEVEP